MSLLVLSVLATMSATAQDFFSDTVAREQTAKNSEQLENLARVVQNMRDQMSSISQQQQAIDQRLRDISGQVEESLVHAINENGQNIKAELSAELLQTGIERQKIHDDLNLLRQEFVKLTQSMSPPEQELYAAAFGNYQQKNYVDAVAGFEAMLRYYPTGQFNANARYWMSESFLAQSLYERAAQTAQQLINLDGENDKKPDAMLTLARAQAGLLQNEDSRRTLEELIVAYPTTLAADKARQLLSP